MNTFKIGDTLCRIGYPNHSELDNLYVGDVVVVSRIEKDGYYQGWLEFKNHPNLGLSDPRYFKLVASRPAPAVKTPVAPASKTKTDRVLAYLTSGKSLTQLEAISLFSLYRLSSVILNLRRQGYRIKTNIKVDVNGTEYAEYSLAAPKLARAA